MNPKDLPRLAGIEETILSEDWPLTAFLDHRCPVEDNITFIVGKKKVITITREGIKFHLEEWPDWRPDDFAKAFIEILERQITVRFDYE